MNHHVTMIIAKAHWVDAKQYRSILLVVSEELLCGSLSDVAQRRHLLMPHEHDAESEGAEEYDGQVDLVRRCRRHERKGEEAPSDETQHADGVVAEYEPAEHGVGLRWILW